ncbi:MAG: hypothetical protein PHD65_07045 [Gallionella sp.]|nr:hypothetical protein [Gallionella sp.]
MQIKFISPAPGNSPGLLRKTATVIVALVLAGVALMFSALLLAVILIVVVFGGAYLWWKTRALRKLMKEQMRDFPPQGATMRSDTFADEVFKGEVIEGEVIRVDESPAKGAGVEFDWAKRPSR